MESLEQKIGQMFMLGFRGLEVSAKDPIARDLNELHLGGVILFDYDVQLQRGQRNIASVDQVRVLNQTLRSFAEIPPLIAVDQEGGEVSRLKGVDGFPPSSSARVLGETDDLEMTRRQAEQTVRALAEMGFTSNFAPSVDLDLNPANPIIGGKARSYGADPEKVTRHAREVIQAHQAQGIGCALKHFPGHGSSEADTHLGFVDVTDSWQETELEPFRRLIAEGECWSVMTAHVFHSGLDPEWPATLSRKVVGGILRDRLGFEGVVFSDDMEMGAISSRYGLETAIFQAISAGVDILVFANNVTYQPDVGHRAVAVTKQLVKEGRVTEARIDESFRRIMTFKKRMGLLP